MKDSKIITDRQGVSRGCVFVGACVMLIPHIHRYGFVTFSTVEEAVKVQEQVGTLQLTSLAVDWLSNSS